MADTTKPSKKSNYVKLVVGLVLALAGYGGADAAGFQFDPEMLSQFGGFALIAYLELRIRPLLVVIAKREALSGEQLETLAAPLVTPAAEPEPARSPRIAVIRPASVRDE